MRIYFCANCGQIGNEAHFQVVTKAVELNPAITKIIQTNNFKLVVTPTCPFCNIAGKLFYKDVIDINMSTQVSSVVDHVINFPTSLPSMKEPKVSPCSTAQQSHPDVVPVGQSNTPLDVDEVLLMEAIASAESPEPTVVTNIPAIKEIDSQVVAQVRNIIGDRGVRTEDTSKRVRKIKCDLCDKEMTTKLPGVTRCQDCINKMIR